MLQTFQQRKNQTLSLSSKNCTKTISVLARTKQGRQTDRQREIEAEFIQSMTALFDIAHADSENIIRIPEDSQFLADQREGRKMTMGREDREFRLKEQKKMQRKLEET